MSKVAQMQRDGRKTTALARSLVEQKGSYVRVVADGFRSDAKRLALYEDDIKAVKSYRESAEGLQERQTLALEAIAKAIEALKVKP